MNELKILIIICPCYNCYISRRISSKEIFYELLLWSFASISFEYLPNPSLFFLQAKNITYPLLVSISSFLRITTTFLHDDNIQGVSYWCDSFSKVTGGNALSNKNMETVALWNLSHPYETPCSSTRWQCRALK